MASGLLPVCFGEATKFSTDTFSADKSYEAEVLLGVTTTTGDREGEVTSRRAVSVTQNELTAVLTSFTGTLEQTPPMYSALKRDGKPLYVYARAGLTVERAARPITIHSNNLLSFECDRFTIEVSCSKGTYIRVLAEDIGAALGCGASLAALRRTRVGKFDLSNAVTLTALEALAESARATALLPVDCLAAGLSAVVLESSAVGRILQGQGVTFNGAGIPPGPVRLYGPAERFLGLGELQADGRLLPKRLVATASAGVSTPDDGSREIPKNA